MSPNSVFFILFDKIIQESFKDIGKVFNYDVPNLNALKIIAEITARTRRRGLGSLFIPTNRLSNIIILPNVNFKPSFCLTDNLDTLYEAEYCFLCIQFDPKIYGNNYIVIKIKEDASICQIYTVKNNKELPSLVTEVITEDNNHYSCLVSRLYKLIISELEYMRDKLLIIEEI